MFWENINDFIKLKANVLLFPNEFINNGKLGTQFYSVSWFSASEQMSISGHHFFIIVTKNNVSFDLSKDTI